MTAVRALTIRQPWADAITHGPKRTENRSRRTHYRGLLLIHAAQAEDRNALPPEMTADWPDTRGAVIAVAMLTGCHHDGRCCRPWGFPDAWHWQLYNVRPLTAPVPAKGALGLWTPPEDVLRAVLTQKLEADQ